MFNTQGQSFVFKSIVAGFYDHDDPTSFRVINWSGKIPEVLPQEKVREIQGQGRQRVQIDQNLVNEVQ
jgi:hypothetical protein